MKSNGKDKTNSVVSMIEPTEPIHDQQENGQGAIKSDAAVLPPTHDKGPDKEQASSINGSIGAFESTPSAVDTAREDAAEIDKASSTLVKITEQDSTMVVVPPRRSNSGSGVSEAINQEDLDGGLLDGALDDYDDLDQDTEDTEIGNVDDFSDDDDDDDLDDRLLDSSDKPDPDDDMHSPGELSHPDTSKSDDQDSEQEDIGDQRRKGLSPVHSDDSDSDLPEPEGSDIENEDEDEEEEDDDDEVEDAEEEDAEDGDMDMDEDERPSKTTLEPRKETVMSQKPTLNRPSATTAEELKDSGDELSDLSDFTDDSDEDEDDVPNPKLSGKESNTNFSASPAVGNGRLQAGGRKRLQDIKDSAKLEQESVKSEQKGPPEITNGKARLSERKAPEMEDVHHSDKESESEEHPEEEEEEEHEKPAEEEEEEEGTERHRLILL